MAGRFGLNAEVLRGLDEADTKNAFPDPIDEDACDQRIVLGGHPVGESETIGRQTGIELSEALWDSRRDSFARGIVLAAEQDLRHWGGRILRQDHDARLGLFERIACLPETV